MTDFVYPKEKKYYQIAFIFSMIIYALVVISAIAGGFAAILIVALYGGMIWLAFFFAQGMFIARLKKDAIKLGETQFSDVMAMVRDMGNAMEMKTIPEVYLLEAGGMLNAFATKFLSRDFVVIYSDIFELAYAKGEDALRFVIAHELGHIHRGHLRNRWKILPGFIIPFLALAYSRACEYTCDRYGKVYGKPSGNQGLLLLGAGKNLYAKVNEADVIRQADDEHGFFMWLTEINSTHPSLALRVKSLKEFTAT